MVPRYRFTREQRITRRMEYQTVYSKGKSASSTSLRIHILSSPVNTKPKLGIAISKKIGKANIRNRLKRCFREIVRLHQYDIKPGTQMVVVAKPGSINLTYSELEQMVLDLLHKLRAIKAKDTAHVD